MERTTSCEDREPNTHDTVMVGGGLFAAVYTDPDGNEITVRSDIPDEACADAIAKAALDAYRRGHDEARASAIEAIRRMACKRAT